MPNKLITFGSEFSRAHNEDEKSWPELLATSTGKNLDNRVTDGTSNEYIWDTLAREIRSHQIEKSDIVIIQYGNMWHKHFYSLERSNDYNELSVKDQKTFDFKEELGILNDAKMSVFTKWKPEHADQQHHSLDAELHQAFENACWDNRDCLWYFNDYFYNRHFQCVRMLQSAGIPALFVITSAHICPLDDDELTAQTDYNGLNINRWIDEFDQDEQTKIITPTSILTKRGHYELSISIYEALYSSKGGIVD